MRKAALTLLSLVLAVPLFATEKHQSYFGYDDGGTIVKQADDGREIEARVNMPVYPGDEVVTNRRGRSEIRLSDGNVLGIDRATSVLFRSILDSYEGDASQTIAELRYGKVALHRTELGRDTVRLDTSNASYVAPREAVYSVETDSRGKDRVMVFDGSIEVRTRTRATRLREGEGAEVDDRGVYDLISDVTSGADDFERWFLRRAERRDGRSSRYLDRRLSYWSDDLDDNGNWVFVTGIGWSWRPYVAAGWRPYYHGHWYTSRSGCLTWVSYDPFGWLPYHYGRWAYDPFHGWVWVPGYGYSPAWVYWWYSPGYVGWAPAGWWDCHRGYYDWAYRPYARAGIELGFGFNGRVRINDVDLRPWTFIDANNIISNRVDRAALTADVIKQRLGRTNGGFATVSSDPARFTREEFRNPAAAINRRALGGGGIGRDAGTSAGDVTPFIRRDADVGGTIRDRIVRGRVGGGSPAAGAGSGSPAVVGTPRGGGIAPIGEGNVAPIGRGSVAPIDGGGNVAPIGRGSVSPIDGSINRGSTGSGSTGTRSGSGDSSWRSGRGDGGRISRGGTVSRGGTEPVNREPSAPATTTPPANQDRFDRDREADAPRTRTETPPERGNDDSWRRVDRSPDPEPETRRNDPPPSGDRSWRSEGGESSSSDVPRRVIERSAGTRVYPRGSEGDSGASRDTSRDRSTSTRSGSGSVGRFPTFTPRSGGAPSSGGSSSSGGRSSGSSGGSSGGSSTRSGGSSGGSSSSGSRGEGGAIKRNDP